MTEAHAQEALAAWVKARRTELPEALAASASKVHARLAKKALYQLRSSGLAVEAPKAPVTTAAPVETAPEEFPAVLSAILGTGERAVFFVRPVRGGGLEVYQGIINDERGVMQLEGGTAKRSTYRTRIEQLQADPSLKVLLVPWERMKLELGRALSMNERSRTAPTEAATDMLRKLGIEPVDPDWAVPPPEPGDEALAATATALRREPELGQWLPSEPAIVQLGKKLEDLEASPLALSDAQKFEQAQLRAQAVAAEYLTAERRRVYARRLWGMAELFDRSGREQAAALARAEARTLFHGSGASRFVEAMFETVVGQRRAAIEAAKATVPAPR
jgi:hypothetical protein